MLVTLLIVIWNNLCVHLLGLPLTIQTWWELILTSLEKACFDNRWCLKCIKFKEASTKCKNIPCWHNINKKWKWWFKDKFNMKCCRNKITNLCLLVQIIKCFKILICQMKCSIKNLLLINLDQLNLYLLNWFQMAYYKQINLVVKLE